MTILVCGLISATLSSCGGDDDNGSDEIPSGVIGTWGGSKTLKTGSERSLTVTFRSDRTGSFQFISNAYYRVAEFTYSMKGSIITCDGFIVGEDGVTNRFDQQFEYRTTYMMPIGNSYSDIKLTK